VTIVSNNSGAAIAAYLADHGLTGYIRAIVARDDHDPERMKPDPYRVREAVAILDADNTECAMIGDSTTTDVFAGLLAGVPVIGYANKPGKTRALADVQAAAVTTDLAEITAALSSNTVC
jgi:beta-phosphoglucomutase-like phosphatase (HAD superfamily)